jgi:hypothetical protein
LNSWQDSASPTGRQAPRKELGHDVRDELQARALFERRYGIAAAPLCRRPELTAQLRDLGIRQEGDPVLRQECAPFDLPTERAEALALWERLRGYVDRL